MEPFQHCRCPDPALTIISCQAYVSLDFQGTGIIAQEPLVREIRLMSSLPSRSQRYRHYSVAHRSAVDWPGSHLGPSNWRPDNRSLGDPASNLFASLESGTGMLGESNAREVASLLSVLPTIELHLIRCGWLDEAAHQLNDPYHQIHGGRIHTRFQHDTEYSSADTLASPLYRTRGVARGVIAAAADRRVQFNWSSSHINHGASEVPLLYGLESFCNCEVEMDDGDKETRFLDHKVEVEELQTETQDGLL